MYNYTLWNSAWCTVLQKDRQKMKLSTRREEGLSVVFDGEVCMWCNFSLGPFSTAVGLVGACQLDWSDYNKIFTNKNSLTLNYRLFLLIHFGDIGINLLAPHCDHTDNFYRDVAVWVFFFSLSLRFEAYALCFRESTSRMSYLMSRMSSISRMGT